MAINEVERPKEGLWSLQSSRGTKEKDIIDQLVDNIDVRVLTQEEVLWRDGVLKTVDREVTPEGY